MDKMLSLEANELDMLLQYPKATQLTVRQEAAPPRRARLRNAARLLARRRGERPPCAGSPPLPPVPTSFPPSLFLPPREQVERLLGVFEERGEAALEEYAVPLLSWSDYQAIKEEGAAPALPAPKDASVAVDRLLPRGAPAPAAPAAVGGGAGEDPLEVAAAASEAGSLDLDDLCGLD
jgi:hypothetical protein